MRVTLGMIAFCGLLAWSSHSCLGQQDQDRYERTVRKAIAFLETKGQAEDGSFSAHAGPGVTALAATALIRHGRSADSPAVARAVKNLQTFVHADGGIYAEGSMHRNYETCLAVMCFGELNEDGKYDQLLKRADAFLRELQWDEGEGIDASDFSYGGAGYGSHKRPDLSNTSFFIDAMHALDHGAEDPAVQRALQFISRCQNLESEHNRTPLSAKNPDGGFYYTCAAGGTSPAGTTETGGLRSYGSMTYAGLKSMIFAGVGPEDLRVKAAIGWIQKNYRLDTNPGIGSAGLFYYYHTFAKALAARGQDVLEDEQGARHDWRAELTEVLAKSQRADGAWTNENVRWLEDDPNLVTAYGLLALSYCREAE